MNEPVVENKRSITIGLEGFVWFIFALLANEKYFFLVSLNLPGVPNSGQFLWLVVFPLVMCACCAIMCWFSHKIWWGFLSMFGFAQLPLYFLHMCIYLMATL